MAQPLTVNCFEASASPSGTWNRMGGHPRNLPRADFLPAPAPHLLLAVLPPATLLLMSTDQAQGSLRGPSVGRRLRASGVPSTGVLCSLGLYPTSVCSQDADAPWPLTCSQHEPRRAMCRRWPWAAPWFLPGWTAPPDPQGDFSHTLTGQRPHFLPPGLRSVWACAQLGAPPHLPNTFHSLERHITVS